jgi:SAM-dependent methyltransferase
MDVTQQTDNNEQTALWNGRAGRAWVEAQEVIDQVLEPFEDLLVEAVGAGPGQRVLDVGCGTGSTTLAVARLLGSAGRCIGVDISDPLIAAARARAEQEDTPASFIRADAQTHAFEPASFDVIMSRFGVMFFDHPVLAFANLRRAARDGAALRAIVWRSAAENPFMTTAERAAAPLLPNLPARQPGAPGQFSFADGHRVSSILEESGWAGIDIRPIDVECTLPEKELVGYFTRLGPVGLVLQEVDVRTRAQVIDTVRTAFDPYVHGTEVRFAAACWMVSARASALDRARPQDPFQDHHGTGFAGPSVLPPVRGLAATRSGQARGRA